MARGTMGSYSLYFFFTLVTSLVSLFYLSSHCSHSKEAKKASSRRKKCVGVGGEGAVSRLISTLKGYHNILFLVARPRSGPHLIKNLFRIYIFVKLRAYPVQ